MYLQSFARRSLSTLILRIFYLFDSSHHRLLQIDLDPASVAALPSGTHGDAKAVGGGGSNGLARGSESALLLAAASTPTPTPRRRHRAAHTNGDVNGVNGANGGSDTMGDGGDGGGGRDQSDLLLASVSRAAVKVAAADLRRHVSQVPTAPQCVRER